VNGYPLRLGACRSILVRCRIFRSRREQAWAESCARESDGAMRGATLTLDAILTELKAERGRLNQAIAALEGTTPAGRGRKKAQNTEKPKRRRMSAATRKRLSEAKRKWWAERKKKAKGA